MININIPKGYKQTKVGVIPEDWEVVHVKDIFQFIKTYSFPRSKLVDMGNIEYLHYGDIHKKYKYHLDFGKNILPKIQLDEIAEENFVKNGDLFIADASEDYDDIGKSAEAINLTNRKVLSGLHTFLLRDIKNKFANGYKGFIFYNQNVSKNIKKIATGISVLGISKSNLGNIQIPLPPLKEQEKIAKILTTWDKAIDLQEKLIKEKETYKLGLIQNLLTCKKRFKEFSGEWEELRLKEIAKFRRGSFPQPYGLAKWYDDKDGFPFVQVYDVDTNFKLKLQTKRKISKLATTQSIFIEKGTIIITIQGSIGRVAITQYDAYVDRTLLLFKKYYKPIRKILFVHILSELFEREKQKAPGGTIKTITKEVLSNFKIKLPQLEEQQKISNFLSLADKEIELLKNKLNELKNQKKSLMQNLLSGKVRVKV